MLREIQTRFPLAYRLMREEAETRPAWKRPQYLLDQTDPKTELAELARDWLDQLMRQNPGHS